LICVSLSNKLFLFVVITREALINSLEADLR